MTAHKYAEMIKAKADNMELVVLCRDKSRECNEWGLYTHEDGSALPSGSIPMFEDGFDYFLCLPQHNENGQCLHWLNGGKIQYKSELIPDFMDYQPDINLGLVSIFMQQDFEIRIKPRKEKRWIAIRCCRGVMPSIYDTESQARKANPYADQFIEIEIDEDILNE